MAFLHRFFCAVFFLAPFFLPVGFAFSSPIPRTILAFYDDAKYPDPFYTNIHQRAEMPLNYLGLKVVYVPLTKPLPAPAALGDVRGILTWFSQLNEVPDPSGFCSWVRDRMKEGLRLVVLEDPGVFKDKRRFMPAECRQVYRLLGVAYGNEYSKVPFYFDVVSKNAEMTEFERKLLLTENAQYSLFKPVGKNLSVYLTMRRTDLDQSDSALVFTGPAGGMAYLGTVTYEVKDMEKAQWRLNPFRFFEEAYATRGLPRPDVTTLYGRRVFYSHIDGDGFFNQSAIQIDKNAGEMILENILQKYTDVPITVSLIAGYHDLPRYFTGKTTDIYKKMLGLPHVEVGSHGYAHPLRWSKGTLALKIPGYTYSAEKEIAGSLAIINDFMMKNGIPKKADIFQWTGDCVPTAEAMRVVSREGVLNINGGDSRFDRKYDSLAHVQPMGILRDGILQGLQSLQSLQINASAGNENTYTNLWEGPYFGFRDVIETFRNTEAPRRLLPVNIYYHFYSGEKYASLKVLQDVYAWALNQEIFPLRTTEYARMVGDFYRMETAKIPGGGFRIAHKGALRTLRFDDEKRFPDFSRSKGVLGYSRHGNDLYVFLDEDNTHDVFLTAHFPVSPHILQAGFWTKNFKATKEEVRFEKKGWGGEVMILGGMAPDASYDIKSSHENLNARADAKGQLKIVFKNYEGNGDYVPVAVRAKTKGTW